MIELAHSLIREQIRKYNGGYKTPPEIDNALYRSLLDFYNELTQRRSRYLDEEQYNISGTNRFDLPEDFSKAVNVFSLVGAKRHEGDILTEIEFADRINSYILAPDVQNPVARIIGSSIDFYPEDAGNFVLSYYRTPFMPVFGYTVAENGRDIIFDADTSVELDIDPTDINTVVRRSLFYLGVSLQEQGLVMEGNGK